MDNIEKQEMEAVSECVDKFPNNQELGNKARQIIKGNSTLRALARRFPNDQDLGKEIRKVFGQ